MLIRMRADKIILSFLLLAGVGSCIADDGYAYQKPVLDFSTGYKPPVDFGGFQGFSQQAVQKPAVVTIAKPAIESFASSVKPQVAFQGFTNTFTTKPQTVFSGFQSFGQSTVNKPAVVSVAKPVFTNTVTAKPFIATVKPQTVFNAYQSTVQKPAVTTTTFSQFGQLPAKPAFVSGQYQQQTVSTTVAPLKAELTYLPPKVATVVTKPQVAFQGFTNTVTAKPHTVYKPAAIAKPAFQSFTSTVTAKPQTVNAYQTVQKPVVVSKQVFQGFTNTVTAKPFVAKPQIVNAYQTVQKPVAVSKPVFQGFTNTVTAKPFVAKPQIVNAYQTVQKPVAVSKPVFQGFTNTVTAKPFVAIAKPQINTFETVQKPAVTSTYLPPKTITVNKPQVAFQGFTSTVTAKPQTVYKPAVVAKPAFQSFTNTVTAKPFIAKPQTVLNAYQTVQKPVVVSKPVFQGFTNTVTAKPFVAIAKPQINTFETVQKPAVTSTYLPPKTITVNKPQVAFQGFTSTVTAKPQTVYKPAVVAKPAFQSFTNTVTAKPFIAKPQTVLNAYQTVQKPVVVSKPVFQGFTNTVTAKPFVAIAKPQINTFETVQKPAVTSTYLPPKTITVNKPQVAFQGFTSTVTAKPQTVYKPAVVAKPAFQSFTNTVTAKPFIAKPQTVLNAYQTVQKPVVVSKPVFQGFTNTVTAKPFVAIAKPQISINTFETVQKPAVTTTYLPPKTITVSKPQVTFQGFTNTVTAKPQTVYKPAVVAKPAFQSFTNTPFIAKPQTVLNAYQTVQKPVVVTKPSFQGFSNQIVPKPQVTFQGFANQIVAKPQVEFQGFTNTVTAKPVIIQAKPQNTFSGFGQTTVFKPPVITGQYQKPATITITKPVQKVGLDYLPPTGAQVFKNVVKSSGAPSHSFFELSSATANQVVDAAPEQKVESFVADRNTQHTYGYTSLSSGLPTVSQQVFRIAQEPKVEKHSQFTSSQFNTNVYTPVQQSIFSYPTEVLTFNQPQAQLFDGGFTKASFDTLQNSAPHISSSHAVHNIQTDVVKEAQGQLFGGLITASLDTPQDSASHIGTSQVVDNIQTLEEGQQTFQTVPAQQFVKTQLTVLDRGQTGVQGSYQVSSNPANTQYESESQHVDYSVDKSPFQYQESAANVINSQLVAEQSSGRSNSEVKAPQPLNQEEQLTRRVEESADSDNEAQAVTRLQPGSYVGPHVNKDSDKEYNVFDYDQYSADPEETDL